MAYLNDRELLLVHLCQACTANFRTGMSGAFISVSSDATSVSTPGVVQQLLISSSLLFLKYYLERRKKQRFTTQALTIPFRRSTAASELESMTANLCE